MTRRPRQPATARARHPGRGLSKIGCPTRIRTETGKVANSVATSAKESQLAQGTEKGTENFRDVSGEVAAVPHGRELSRIVNAWATLPKHIRAAMLALVDGEKGGLP